MFQFWVGAQKTGSQNPVLSGLAIQKPYCTRPSGLGDVQAKEGIPPPACKPLMATPLRARIGDV